MPGLEVSSTTRIMVCHGVAPRASEPWVKCLGTPKMASSAIEKILAMTANPMARPTTSELRWSKAMPMVFVSQLRKTPPKKTSSSAGLAAREAQPSIGRDDDAERHHEQHADDARQRLLDERREPQASKESENDGG